MRERRWQAGARAAVTHALLVSATVGLVAAVAPGCQRGAGVAPAATPSAGAANATAADVAAPRPQQELEDYRLTETGQGVRRWVLASDRMRKFAGREELELVDVHMDFYRAGEHYSVLDADSGRVNPRTRAVHVWGAVDIVTDDGRRLQTEDLLFDNVTGRITNDVFNRYTRGEDVLTGYGIDATPDLAYVEIKREVAAEVADTEPVGGEEP